MLTEDYIMRMIRLAVAAIAKALGLKAMELYTDALYVLDQALTDLLGLPVDLLNRMDEASFLAHLTDQGELDVDRLLVAADLYREEADIYVSVKDSAESRWRYLRALNFYLEVVQHGGLENFPPPDAQIDAVVNALGLATLPSETLYALSGYWEELGKFRPSADAMEQMLTQLGPVEEVKTEVSDFYRRLLEKSDQALSESGIDRAQIKARLKSLS